MPTRREFLKSGLKTAGGIAAAAVVVSLPGCTDLLPTVDPPSTDYWMPEVHYRLTRIGREPGGEWVPVERGLLDKGFRDAPGGEWVPVVWSLLKPGDIIRFRGPDGQLENEGTEREVHLVTGDGFKDKTGVWGVECVPCTVVALTDPMGSYFRVWKDGVRVGLVQEIDFRTCTMKRIPTFPIRPEKVIEEPFDYVTVDMENFDTVNAGWVDNRVLYDGVVVGAVIDVEKTECGFHVGRMMLNDEHLQVDVADALGFDSLRDAQLVYTLRNQDVIFESWGTSWYKDGTYILEDVRLGYSEYQAAFEEVLSLTHRNDPTFNEKLRAAYKEVGDSLVENSNVAEVIAERMGIKLKSEVTDAAEVQQSVPWDDSDFDEQARAVSEVIEDALGIFAKRFERKLKSEATDA